MHTSCTSLPKLSSPQCPRATRRDRPGKGSVASYTRARPLEKCINVSPSGRFPSSRVNPVGSSIHGTPVEREARLNVSLRAAWRGRRPAGREQERPWCARHPTGSPQVHLCMWLHEVSTHAESDADPGRLVVKSGSYGVRRNGVQPFTGARAGHCQKTSAVVNLRKIVQKSAVN